MTLMRKPKVTSHFTVSAPPELEVLLVAAATDLRMTKAQLVRRIVAEWLLDKFRARRELLGSRANVDQARRESQRTERIVGQVVESYHEALADPQFFPPEMNVAIERTSAPPGKSLAASSHPDVLVPFVERRPAADPLRSGGRAADNL